MNPEKLTSETLRIFNSLDSEAQREALLLSESRSENEAVCLAAMRRMSEREKRKLIFRLSRERWKLNHEN